MRQDVQFEPGSLLFLDVKNHRIDGNRSCPVGGIDRLWNNDRVRDALSLCSRGANGGQRFLFEIIPDIFPEGFLTEAERLLWGRFYTERFERSKDKDQWQT